MWGVRDDDGADEALTLSCEPPFASVPSGPLPGVEPAGGPCEEEVIL